MMADTARDLEQGVNGGYNAGDLSRRRQDEHGQTIGDAGQAAPDGVEDPVASAPPAVTGHDGDRDPEYAADALSDPDDAAAVGETLARTEVAEDAEDLDLSTPESIDELFAVAGEAGVPWERVQPNGLPYVRVDDLVTGFQKPSGEDLARLGRRE